MTETVPVTLASVPMRDGYPTFSDAEIERRHALLRTVMAKNDVQAALAYGPGRFNAEMLYLSNWPGGREGFVLLPALEEPTLLVQLFNHVPLARHLSLVRDTRWAGADSMLTVAEAIREGMGGHGRLGLIGPWRAADRDRLAGLLPGVTMVDLTAAYRIMRQARSQEELAFLRVAADLTDRSMERLEAELCPGMREYELARILEDTYLEGNGYAGIHYMSSTSMAHPKAFVPHQYQSDRILRNGDVLITEISGGFWGYASQIHRTFTLGAPPTDEYVRLHQAATAAFDAVAGVLRDGATAEDVLDAAEIIEREGLSIVDDLLHSLDQYPPILRTRATDHGYPRGFRFTTDMVVTIQPHVVTPDRRIGLQFGETLRIADDGVEALHRFRRGPIVVAA